MAFDAHAVPDQSGKVFVVTGANGGIGFEAARVLAARRARVILAGRDPSKLAAALASLTAETPGAAVESVVLDLASLASVRTAAASLRERAPRIDVLVNNAGVMAIPFRQTPEGFEMQLGTNHLGHFALTGLLLSQLQAAPHARVVTVSSLLHTRGEVVFEDIPVPERYDANRAYAMSKLANLLFAYELDRRLVAAGSPVRSLACHPGYSATNLQHVGPTMSGSKVRGALMSMSNSLLAQSAQMGALPTLMAASSDEVTGGDYVGPTGLFGMRGHPVRAKSSAASHDRDVASKLWGVSERLTGVRYDLVAAKPG